MVIAMKFTITELRNLKFMIGRVPFDYVCYMLYRFKPSEIREMLLDCGLADADTFNVPLSDKDCLAKAYKTDRLGLLYTNLWHTSYELLKAIEGTVELTAEDKAYLEKPLSPVSVLGFDIEKTLAEYEDTEKVCDILYESDYEIQLHYLIGGYGVESFILAIELLHRAMREHKSDKLTTYAWLGSDYFKEFESVTGRPCGNGVAFLERSEIADKEWDRLFELLYLKNNEQEVQQDTVEEGNQEGVEEQPETANKAEENSEGKENLCVEPIKSDKIESKSEENSEISRVSEQKAYNIYAPTRMWTAEELTLLVEYMTFMKLEHLAVLLQWDRSEVEHKMKELMHKGILTVDRLREFL